jgi:hypothetical protein
LIVTRLYISLYQFALRAFPNRHRTAYAAEMIDTFERELRERREGAMRFVLAACANVIVAGFGERRRYRRVGRTNVLFARLDFILAWRMMLRYPGLSIVAMFGMTVGIAIATGAFAIISAMTNAKLPLPEGDRIVSLLLADTATGHREPRMLPEVTAWRGLTSVEDIGVTRTVRRNLMLPGQAPDEVTIAEISASAFRVAGVPALRGRQLLPEDERPDDLCDRRCDAGGLWVSAASQLLDPVAPRCEGLRAAQRSERGRLRTARRRRDDRARPGGDRGARPADGRALAGDP